MKMACSKSPIFLYSFASGAKYRRGFSSNFFRSSSIREGPAIELLSDGTAGWAGGSRENTFRQQNKSIRKCRAHLILHRRRSYFSQLLPTYFLPLRSIAPCCNKCGARVLSSSFGSSSLARSSAAFFSLKRSDL